MENLYHVIRFLHIMSFVFMSVPLFNLIVVNERVLLGTSFTYYADRYMENIIRRGAVRCYIFQTSALVTGLLLLVMGPLGIEAVWNDEIIRLKTLLLLTLMALLSYVHFSLQPRIEALLADIGPDTKIPQDLPARLKPYRVRRKRLATLCLFLVITTIILGVQTYNRFSPLTNLILIALAVLFAWRANRTLIRFGWI